MRTLPPTVLTTDYINSKTLKARYWVRLYGLSHGLYLADALIAATASVYGYQLISVNMKDFHFLDVQFASIKH